MRLIYAAIEIRVSGIH